MNTVKFKKIINEIRLEGSNVGHRFVLFIISGIAIILSLILLLLNIFGVLNIGNIQVMDMLETQLQTYSDNLEHDYNKIAAYAISYSKQLEDGIQDFLSENNLSFEDLQNNNEAITDLQNKLYDTIYLNMQLAPSSGAFYILNTTVNSNLDASFYNGIYLKYINLYSESTVNNEFSLYRGSFITGKNNDINFHSGWQNEMKTDFFEKCDSLFTSDTHYILSNAVEIPDTWERARYVYVPIYDYKKNIIGVCGFEVNDLYFQLAQKSNNDKLGPIICALLDEEQGIYSGQFNSNRYNSLNSASLNVIDKKSYTVFDFDSEKCVGKTKEVQLGNDTFSVALMLTEPQYQKFINKGKLTTAGIFLFVALFSFVCCLFMFRKYLSPILHKMEQMKSKEEQLKALELAKEAAEEEARRAKDAYEKALAKYSLTQSELIHITDEYKKEIIPEDYEHFVSNLDTLTPTEERIYQLYQEGKKQTEIAEIIGIKINTMKYHTKNIYSKLGISSRKQLLRFAVLKQQQDKQGK